MISPIAKKWVVTGAAGFIGSHLVETLLRDGHDVTGLDDLSACGMKNLNTLAQTLPPEAWQRFTLITGDIRDEAACAQACQNADVILHHAAIGSVPRSIAEPDFVYSVNVEGFRQVLAAARKAGVKRVVYASSSAVYGDVTAQANHEELALRPLSPYAAGKVQNEHDAAVSGLETVGLRYFNIYGPRQDPNGAYAAVIPRWIDTMGQGQAITIHGDGSTTRDFCFVGDAVRANLQAAATTATTALNTACNIATGTGTSLSTLYETLHRFIPEAPPPLHDEFRAGDIRHSVADIDRARQLLDFTPRFTLQDGLRETVAAYTRQGVTP